MSEQSDVEFLAQLRSDFLNEATFLLEQCEEVCLELENSSNPDEELAKIFRVVHTVKGSGATAGFADLASFAHVFEDCLSLLRQDTGGLDTEIISLFLASIDALAARVDYLKHGLEGHWDISHLEQQINAATLRLKSGNPEQAAPAYEAGSFGVFDEEPVAKATALPTREKAAALPGAEGAPKVKEHREATASSVKVDATRVDSILSIVSELVVIKSQLLTRSAVHAHDQLLNGVVSLLDKTVRELQEKALGIRMTSMRHMFIKLQRLSRDLALKLEKNVDFTLEGEDTELDRSVVDLISDPLMHIVRNCMDHGLEPVTERRQVGKPDQGTISVSARQVGSRVVLRVADDGRGVDMERVIRKGVEKGLIRDPQRVTEREAFDLLFMPGFSTAAKVSEVSGRGVGLDVVKSNVEKLKGSIELSSYPGRGVVFTIYLPLTTAITEGLLVSVADHPYVIPMEGIREIVRLEGEAMTGYSDEREVIKIRERLFPLLDMGDIMFRQPSRGYGRRDIAVVVETTEGKVALKVEAVMEQVQIVLKPLTEDCQSRQWVAGAGILGDGRAVLVLDVNILAKSSNNVMVDIAPQAALSAS